MEHFERLSHGEWQVAVWCRPPFPAKGVRYSKAVLPAAAGIAGPCLTANCAGALRARGSYRKMG
jgi:hypothetical protein